MEEILKKLREPLRIDQIDFRIQSITEKGFATILAYKDARVDMNRLDEVCGVNWQDDYKLLDGQLYCGIAIKHESEWIWRWDVGIESNTEAVKGRASDAFKRSGFRWGIGRELYDYPRIQLMLLPHEFKVANTKSGKKIGQQTYKLKLDKWKWDIQRDGEKIVRLTAHDETGALRYDSTKDFNGAPGGNNSQPVQQPVQQPQTQNPAPTNTKASSTNTGGEKPWLNKMDGKDFTREWLNILTAFNKKKLTSIDQVKAHYKLSKETEAELQQIFNYQPA